MPSPLLTPRQRECLIFAQMGKSTTQVANLLGISEHTVYGYFTEAYRRLGARNRTHAVSKAVRLGEIAAYPGSGLSPP